MGPDGKGSGMDLGRVAAVVAAIIVSYVLLSNAVALVLSFPTVWQESPDVYRSGFEGSISLPFVPWSEKDLEIELPYEVPGNASFPVRVIPTAGSLPLFPLYLVLDPGTGRTFQFRLFPEVAVNGSSFLWTLIPPGIPEGNYSAAVSYDERDAGHIIRFDDARIRVLKPDNAFAAPALDRGLATSNTLRISIIGEGGDGVKSVMLRDREGSAKTLSRNASNGDFELDLDRNGIHGWSRMTLETVWSDGSAHSQGSILFLAPYDEWTLPVVDSVELSMPLSEFDELYGQDGGGMWKMGEDNVGILTSTYYSINVTIDPGIERGWDGMEGIPSVPLPQPLLSFEGKRACLAPVDPSGIFRGVYRTPSGYNDHGDGGMVIRVDNWTDDNTILSRDIIFEVRQSPLLTIDPDPFSRPLGPGSNITIRISDGWELVSYRKFPEVPAVSLDGTVLPVGSSPEEGNDDLSAYKTGFILENGSRGQVLHIAAATEFRMEWTLFLLIPTILYPMKGIMIPIWFTVISLSIVMSLVILTLRSTKGTKGGRWRERGWRNPFSDESDIGTLATTFMGALFFSWAVVILFQIMEQPTPVPDVLSEATPDWIQMVLLANASVWEEITSRVVMIGIPLALIEMSRTKKASALAFLLGGRGRVGRNEFVLILLSSMIFGLMHLGWGPWKVLPTFVTGALFGYLYVKVGLHASIAMHFLFDYDSFIFDLLGIPNTQIYIIYYFALITGGFFLAMILARTKWFIEDRSRRRIHPGWILLIHSAGAIFLLIHMFLSEGDATYMVILACIPVLDLAGYVAAEWGLKGPSIVLVTISSLFTLPLAPVGLVWNLDRWNARRNTHGSRS